MLPEQKQLKLSPYSSLYDIIVPKDDDLRKIKELVDFSFVYEELKTHLAMSEERIVTAATITSGEKHDGKELKILVDKSKNARIEVETIIGDGALYSGLFGMELQCALTVFTANIKRIMKLIR